jgi:hypothetical protein
MTTNRTHNWRCGCPTHKYRPMLFQRGNVWRHCRRITLRGTQNWPLIREIIKTRANCINTYFFPLWLYSQIQAFSTSMKLSVSLQLLDPGQSVGLPGRVISSSQGLYLYINTEKRTHNTNTKHSCPEWDSNPRFRRPRERRHFMH